MFKKIISAALIFALLFTAFPLTASASAVSEFQFETLADGGLAIVGYTGPTGSNVTLTIPRFGPDGFTEVRVIRPEVFRNRHFYQVNFAEHSAVHTIERRAFMGSGLTRVNLPASMRSIGEGAFEDTVSLTQLTLPAGLLEIGPWAFSGTRIARISVPASVTHIGANAFSNNPSLWDAHFQHNDGAAVSVAANAFSSVSPGFRITRPHGAERFPSNWHPQAVTHSVNDAPAADGDWIWTPLTGNNIMLTGVRPGSALSTAERVEIPATIEGRTVRQIQGRTFDHNNHVREVVIPNTVTVIQALAFNNNRDLRTVYFRHNDGDTVEVSRDAFVGAHHTFSIVYPYGARGFTTPTWHGFPAAPEHLEGIWEFRLLGGINAVIITRYNGTAAVVEVPSMLDGRQVHEIGNEVFVNNTTITEIVFPESIVSIAANAVYNVPNLQTARLRHQHADTLFVHGSAFTRVHRDFTIVHPADATGFTNPMWGFPAEPDLLSAFWVYTVSGGVATITEYRGNEQHVEIPGYLGGSPVRIIASEAFRNNSYMERVTIPASVHTIRPNAFFNNPNLYAAHLLHTNTNQFTEFSRYSFVGIASNFRLIVPNNATGFTSPFWNGYFTVPESDALTLTEGYFEFTIRREALPGMAEAMHDVVHITRYFGTESEVVIPATLNNGRPVVGIGDFAFQQNQTVRRVVIPASVRSIGHSAFLGASNLENAVFLHLNGEGLVLHANTFRYTHADFTIIYPPNAVGGFTSPTWQGWPARQGTAAPGTEIPSPEPPPEAPEVPQIPGHNEGLRNPLIHTNRTLSQTDSFHTRDGELLHAPIFRLEPFAPNPQFVTSYVMVRVIADILGLDWTFDDATRTATFTGYNEQNQFITMELTINSTTMRVNGIPRDVRASAGTVPAISREGRLFVPVLVFQEVFGVTIQWNGENRTVTVNP